MKILRGTVFGGIAYFFLGWLIYGILFMEFFSASMNQCANRPDGDIVWWALLVSNFSAALLLTIILNGFNAQKLVDGLKTGAMFGVLFAAIVGFSNFSMTSLYGHIGSLLVDIILSTVMFTIVGMVIVLTWGKQKAYY